MEALKVTISGSYSTSTRDVIDFDNISGVIPFVSDAKVKQYVRKRYAYEWVRTAKTDDGEIQFKERISQMRQTFIENIVPIEHVFTYIGKNIKEMSYEELTDLATANDLIEVPLPKGLSGVDLREMRTLAYVEFAKKIEGNLFNIKIRDAKGKFIKYQYTINTPPRSYADETLDHDENMSLIFNFSKLPALVVDGDVRINQEKKVTNDEVISQEMQPKDLTGETQTPFEKLKAIAVEKGITLHHRNSYESLYEKVYGRPPE